MLRMFFLSSVIVIFSGCAVKNVEKKVDINETLPPPLHTEKVQMEDNPLLSKPKIAKVKIQSYIDADGDYREASTLHLKIEESKFIDKKHFSINKD
ncbi:MAG: TraV family lipoprotein [Sulfurimonas sp.]